MKTASEIKARSPYLNLRVSTIHDFLWDIIKSYQQNLKKCLCELISEYSEENKAGIKYEGDLTLNVNYFSEKPIEYKDYRKLEEGIVWHDDILKIAHRMFEKYPLLCDIIKDKFQYILVDEYQDTDKLVINILLEHLQRNDKKTNVVGFFGDSMQSIYEDKGVGNIKSYVDSGLVKEVKKEDNYRCSEKVIGLINQLRTDGIMQKVAGNNNQGAVTFIYSNKADITITELKSYLDVFSSWNFDDPKEVKELYLTHRLISREYGFTPLMTNYNNTDRLLGDENKRDKLANHLFKIQELIHLYNQRKYNDVIKKTSWKIRKLSDKKELKEKIEELNNNARTIEDLISIADKNLLVRIDDKLTEFLKEDIERYNKIKILDRVQVERVYNYVEGYSPYSTQHGIKGAEFNNVLVILDNGGWNRYNFKHLFEDTVDKEEIKKRTLKIFYVCCSRAKDNLVVFYHKPSITVLAKAKEWFGVDNVREI
ncbi:MAG: UvrD-helicase domain-containing protein [Anaerovoracaceae bacterium]